MKNLKGLDYLMTLNQKCDSNMLMTENVDDNNNLTTAILAVSKFCGTFNALELLFRLAVHLNGLVVLISFSTD
jgi:hypothetical protein